MSTDFTPIHESICEISNGTIVQKKSLLGKPGFIHLPSSQKLHAGELHFETGSGKQLKNYFSNGDFEAMRLIPQKDYSNIMLKFLYTKDGSAAAAQIYEYVPYQYAPVTPPLMLSTAQTQVLLQMLKKA